MNDSMKLPDGKNCADCIRLLIELDEVELLLDQSAITFIDPDGKIDDKPVRKAYRDIFDELRDYIHMTGETRQFSAVHN